MAIIPSYYTGLASSANMQFLLDSSQANLEQQSIWRSWLNPGIPQMSLTFEAAIGRDRIAAAASIVDSDAPAPLRSRNKIERYSGKIPAIKQKFQMTQDDMRNLEVLKALQLGSNNNQMLIDFLVKDMTECAVAGDKRVDHMFLQALSTLSVDVTTTNNPDGVAYGTVDLLPQSYQLQGVPTVWSDVASTPVDDIENFITINRDTRGRTFGKILMSTRLWNYFKKTTQVKSYLASFYNTGKANSAFAVTLANVNEYFTQNGWPIIQIIEHNTHIEVDGKPTFVRGFDDNNVAFVPDGKIGTLMSAFSMEELPQHRVAGKSYAMFGRTMISKWGENDPLREFTMCEMNAFPALDIDSIFVLKTQTVQSSFV